MQKNIIYVFYLYIDLQYILFTMLNNVKKFYKNVKNWEVQIKSIKVIENLLNVVIYALAQPV